MMRLLAALLSVVLATSASAQVVTGGGGGSGGSVANPTGTIGLTAVNGSASSAIRSDGAPALSQAIVPTWTGLHTWTPATNANAINITGGSITGAGTSTVGINITGGTLNTTGAVDGVFMFGRVTETACGGNCYLIDVQGTNGGFTLNHFGAGTFGSTVASGGNVINGSTGGNALFVWGNNNMAMASPSATNVEMTGYDSATPAASVLQAQDVVAGTSNTAGVSLTIQGGNSTGTGAGGSLLFKTAPAGTTGTAKNSQTTALTIDSTQKATFAGAVSVATNLQMASHLLCSATAPTIGSGFGTSPSIVANNGSCSFQVNVGTGGSATSGVIGLPTATTGWVCMVTDITTNSTAVFLTKQTASSTTSCTVGNFSDVAVATAWAASDKLNVIATAY